MQWHHGQGLACGILVMNRLLSFSTKYTTLFIGNLNAVLLLCPIGAFPLVSGSLYPQNTRNNMLQNAQNTVAKLFSLMILLAGLCYGRHNLLCVCKKWPLSNWQNYPNQWITRSITKQALSVLSLSWETNALKQISETDLSRMLLYLSNYLCK